MGANASDWSPASAAWRLVHGVGVEHSFPAPDDGVDEQEPLNRVVKLLVLSAVASVASVGNIFVISAVLMEEHLKKRGTSNKAARIGHAAGVALCARVCVRHQ